MAPGALDALTKEMIYLAVSASNQCAYCIASHTASARKAGNERCHVRRTDGSRGMANETNRLSSAIRWKSTSASRRQRQPQENSSRRRRAGVRIGAFEAGALVHGERVAHHRMVSPYQYGSTRPPSLREIQASSSRPNLMPRYCGRT